MNEAMQKLIDAVQKASPVVWQAAYRQVWVDGIENLLLLALSVAVALYLLKLRKKVLADDDDASEPLPIVIMVGSVACFGLCIPFLIDAIDCFSNPTFQAIKALKGLL